MVEFFGDQLEVINYFNAEDDVDELCCTSSPCEVLRKDERKNHHPKTFYTVSTSYCCCMPSESALGVDVDVVDYARTTPR